MSKLEQKEKRIREAYIEGIDTKEEYKENKLLLAEERQKLDRLIEEEKKKNAIAYDINSAEELILRIKDILTLIKDPEADTLKKHQALETILEKMEYRRDLDSFSFYYLYT